MDELEEYWFCNDCGKHFNAKRLSRSRKPSAQHWCFVHKKEVTRTADHFREKCSVDHPGKSCIELVENVPLKNRIDEAKLAKKKYTELNPNNSPKKSPKKSKKKKSSKKSKTKILDIDNTDDIDLNNNRNNIGINNEFNASDIDIDNSVNDISHKISFNNIDVGSTFINDDTNDNEMNNNINDNHIENNAKPLKKRRKSKKRKSIWNDDESSTELPKFKKMKIDDNIVNNNDNNNNNNNNNIELSSVVISNLDDNTSNNNDNEIIDNNDDNESKNEIPRNTKLLMHSNTYSLQAIDIMKCVDKIYYSGNMSEHKREFIKDSFNKEYIDSLYDLLILENRTLTQKRIHQFPITLYDIILVLRNINYIFIEFKPSNNDNNNINDDINGLYFQNRQCNNQFQYNSFDSNTTLIIQNNKITINTQNDRIITLNTINTSIKEFGETQITSDHGLFKIIHY